MKQEEIDAAKLGVDPDDLRPAASPAPLNLRAVMREADLIAEREGLKGEAAIAFTAGYIRGAQRERGDRGESSGGFPAAQPGAYDPKDVLARVYNRAYLAGLDRDHTEKRAAPIIADGLHRLGLRTAAAPHNGHPLYRAAAQPGERERAALEQLRPFAEQWAGLSDMRGMASGIILRALRGTPDHE